MAVYLHHAPVEMGALPASEPHSHSDSPQPSASTLRSSSLFRGVQMVVFIVNLAHLGCSAGIAAMEHRLEQLEEAMPSKCKLVLCGLDFRPADETQTTSSTTTNSDAAQYPCVGIDGRGDTDCWNDVKEVLDSLDHQTCNMLRFFNVGDQLATLEFFEDLYYLSKTSKRRSWTYTMPGLLKERVPHFSEKLNTLLKHKSHPNHYEELDKLIHEAIFSEHIKLSDLIRLFIMKKLDRKSFAYLFSHFPHIQNWPVAQPPTYQFMFHSQLIKSTFDWASENVPQYSKVPAEVSMPFLLLSVVPVEQLFGTQITTLNLSHNRLSQVPHNFFQEAKCLKVLDLSWNKLISLSETISKCLELTELNVACYCHCHSNFPRLSTMTLQLPSLPFTLAGHVRQHKLHYLPNPLENMRKCNSSEEMADYLDELAASGITRWNRVRLMIVGSVSSNYYGFFVTSSTGKCWKNDFNQEISGFNTYWHFNRYYGEVNYGLTCTDGIEITDLQIRDVTFTFFLTGRALYLVLFNLQTPDTLRIEYWLRQIARTVKQPPSPPVILVGTHADLFTEESARISCQSIFKLFRCIGSLVDCVPVSTLEGKIGELQNSIIKTSISKQMLLRERVPERTFIFPCLPMGIFGRLLVRILHFNGIGRKAFWKNNIRLEIMTAFDARCQSLSVFFDCTSGNNPGLFIRVRAHQDLRPDVLSDVLECVDTTVECFYKSLELDIHKFITCNHCPLPVSPTTPQPYQFTLAEVIESISGHKTLVCKNESIQLRLDKLAPELTLGNQSQITKESIANLTMIASGGFGKVYKGEMNGEVVAVKELLFHEGDDPKEKFAEFRKEAMLMSSLDNPYVVKLFGVCLTPPMMVMEFIPNGTLFDLLHKPSTTPQTFESSSASPLDVFPSKDEDFHFPMNWRFRLLLALDISRGMNYLHSLKPPVVHRDLRSPNIFILSLDPTAPVRAKVADFGLSVRAAGKVAGNLSTWQWLAPEVIDCHAEDYDEKSDIFSLGIVFYELATRMYPYDEYAENPKYSRKKGTSIEWREQNIKIAISQEGLRPTIPETAPKIFGEIMHKCWNRVPNLRPSAEEIAFQLEGMLEIPHTPTEEKEAEQGPELPELPEESPLWQIFDEAKSWCITENAGALWLSFADGTVRRLSKTKGTIIGSSLDLEHKTRIYSIIFVNNELWASTELGIVMIFDLETMKKKEELPLHKFKQSISQLLYVSVKDTHRVWSSCPTEYTIVAVEPLSREVVNRVTFDKTVNVHFLVFCDCDETIWVGCLNKIVILDALTMTIQRSITDIVSRFSSCVYLNKQVWGATKGKILVFDCEHKNLVATLVGHETDISWLQTCEGYMCSCDQEGSIIFWHPRHFTAVKTITIKGCFITRMFYFSSLLFYTFVHPNSGVGCYLLGKLPSFPEEDPLLEITSLGSSTDGTIRRRVPSSEITPSFWQETHQPRTSPPLHDPEGLSVSAPGASTPPHSATSALAQVRRRATFLSLRHSHGHTKSMSVSGPIFSCTSPPNNLSPPLSTSSSSLSPRNGEPTDQFCAPAKPLPTKIGHTHISQIPSSQSSPTISTTKTRALGSSFFLSMRKKAPTPPPSERITGEPPCIPETLRNHPERDEIKPIHLDTTKQSRHSTENLEAKLDSTVPEKLPTPDTSPEPETKKESPKRGRALSRHEIEPLETGEKPVSTQGESEMNSGENTTKVEKQLLRETRMKARDIERALSELRASSSQEPIDVLAVLYGDGTHLEERVTKNIEREERKKAREERKKQRNKERGSETGGGTDGRTTPSDDISTASSVTSTLESKPDSPRESEGNTELEKKPKKRHHRQHSRDHSHDETPSVTPDTQGIPGGEPKPQPDQPGSEPTETTSPREATEPSGDGASLLSPRTPRSHGHTHSHSHSHTHKKAHHFKSTTLTSDTPCKHCSGTITGSVESKVYLCTLCGFAFHKECMESAKATACDS
ncbi:leucinerich repeat kinase [Pelomyxa schiedti]|nr:leucinerich repeat kinase [Pelomyxa schiedti]